MADTLLIEILTEELPPKSLRRLMEAFSKHLFDALNAQGFLSEHSAPTPYATPRRLAVRIAAVLPKQPDRVVERRGPAAAAGFDADGKPTTALLGFAKSCGVDVDALERRTGDKGEYFVYRAKQKGEALAKHLGALVEASLKKLPVAKVMRWGAGDAQFVRPVHGLVMLHGSKLVPGAVLGVKSGRKTHGHRFLSKGALTLADADSYEKILARGGAVIADYDARVASIEKQLDAAAKAFGAKATWNVGKTAELTDEVASIVEQPSVYAGGFSEDYLSVPKECLIVSMQQHQRYFPLENGQGKLLPHFLFVSNIKTRTPKHIIHGNERVLNARLADAKFFFDQDKKTRLDARLPRLAQVVYHNKLGSQLERVQRIEKLATAIAERLVEFKLLPAEAVAQVERAAHLCKADLLTDMVGEFPELQGIMGRYYAAHDGDTTEVATAIEEHYLPKAAGGVLPRSLIGVCVALADKLDTLVGIYGIGLVPTGDKDPFGLRRAALGVIRLLTEKGLPLDVRELLSLARAQFSADVAQSVAQDLHGFMLDRLKPYLREQGYLPDEIDAVLSLQPTRIDQVMLRMQALREFRRLPEAQALAAANKRIQNILRQAGIEVDAAATLKLDGSLLVEEAEVGLRQMVADMSVTVAPLFDSGHYTDALKRLAQLRTPVDAFFDHVMVMVDDDSLRQARLALLSGIRALFLGVADISKLQS
jgi:glycyl-tRNA synthetase beta chain